MGTESRSTKPFFSFTAGKGYISLSKFLTTELAICDGDHIVWLNPLEHLWAFYITKKRPLYSHEIKKVTSGDGMAFRFNSLDISVYWAKAFKIDNGTSLRLHINLREKIEKEINGEKVSIYFIFTYPNGKDLIDDENLEKWLTRKAAVEKQIEICKANNLPCEQEEARLAEIVTKLEYKNTASDFYRLLGVPSSQTYLAPPINPSNLNHPHQMKTEEKDVLKITLDEMWERKEVSLRTRNALALSEHHIKTIGDLKKVSKNDLLKIKNFGKKSLHDLVTALEKYVIKLKED